MPDKHAKPAETLPDVLPADSELFDDVQPSAPADPVAQTINTPGQMAKSSLKLIGRAGSDVLQGIGESALKTSYGVGKILLPDWLIGAHPESDAAAEKLTTPDNNLQGAAKLGTDAAQFLVPGEGEEMAVSKLASMAPKAAPLARIGVGALSAGAVNKAQGGTFTGGALTGGASGALSEGLRAVAPSAMKSALRVGSEGLEYDRNTGKSVLEHTHGIRPGTIAKEAQGKVSDWSNELDAMAENAPNANLTPIRRSHQARISGANYSNSPTEQTLLERLRQPLVFEYENGKPALRPVMKSVDEATGILDDKGTPITRSVLKESGTEPVPLPASISAHRLRAIKQGVGSEIGNFSPQNQALGAEYKKAIYGDIDQEFNRVVPGSAELDQRMSSLIPAIRAGQKVENAAPMSQRIMHRAAAHTGALAGTIYGGYEGYQHGGVPGAIAGGAAGLVIPEIAGSPITQALIARRMYSPATGRILRSVATPATRETLDWIKKQNTGSQGSRE